MAGTISLSKLNKRENLLSAFEAFDKDNSGYLTTDALHDALTVRGPAGAVAGEGLWSARGFCGSYCGTSSQWARKRGIQTSWFPLPEAQCRARAEPGLELSSCQT